MSVLLESQREFIDIYFHYLKKKGYYDYVDEILPATTTEEGIRLESQLNYPKTIITDRITFVNIHNVLGQVAVLSNV